jgi:DNA-binding transcriptional regulator YdaS (Cro superfamily)
MELNAYLKRFDAQGRADFALRVGTTLGHLNNVAYGARVASAALARQIALRTAREVAEWDLRPADWHLIWPELIGADGAPSMPTQEPSHVA